MASLSLCSSSSAECPPPLPGACRSPAFLPGTFSVPVLALAAVSDHTSVTYLSLPVPGLKLSWALSTSLQHFCTAQEFRLLRAVSVLLPSLLPHPSPLHTMVLAITLCQAHSLYLTPSLFWWLWTLSSSVPHIPSASH